MKKIAQLIQLMKSRHARPRRKTRAQSMVEFAITLPVLLLLFTGLVEFGFALNFYLSLMDATREAARYSANWDPFERDAVTNARIGDNMDFYSEAATMVVVNLDPKVARAEYEGRRIILDPARDDVLVSVFEWTKAGGLVQRYPTAGIYRLYHHGTSRFTETEIANRFQSDAPNAGLVLVEVHYNYNEVLALPFLEEYVPDIILRAYTIMPLSALN
jgi:hypothetical protein